LFFFMLLKNTKNKRLKIIVTCLKITSKLHGETLSATRNILLLMLPGLRLDSLVACLFIYGCSMKKALIIFTPTGKTCMRYIQQLLQTEKLTVHIRLRCVLIAEIFLLIFYWKVYLLLFLKKSI